MSDLRTAANQMLEALEGGADSWQLVGPAIDALKEALVEPDIDPVDEYRKGFIDGQIDMRDRPAEPVQEPVRLQCTTCGTVYADGVPPQVPVQEPVGFKDAPERIWLQACEDDHCEVPFREHDEITWCAEQQNPLDVPYVRADLASPPQRPAEPAGVVTSMVKGGVTWHIWPDQMPDGTKLYAAAPIIKPEIKEDKPFGYFRAEPFGWTDCAPTDEGAIPLYDRPQAQQFLCNAWADEQIQKEKK